MTIKDWIKQNHLQVEWAIDDKVFVLGEDFYSVIGENEKTFDENFDLILNAEEIALAEDCQSKYYVFEFGEHWFYTKVGAPIKLDLFKYIGESDETGFPYFGVHGGYELNNGSRDYEDWCKKAKSLKVTALAVCEKNTLGGTLKFQDACKKFGIKPIIGETVVVKRADDSTYQLKLYCKNEIGWNNLLWINKAINVDNDKFVEEEYLLKRLSNLVCVIQYGTKLDEKFIENFKSQEIYYQVDPVEYLNNDRDKRNLEALKDYQDNWSAFISPILVCDTYYLDQSENKIKDFLNTVGKISSEGQSEDQFFKSKKDVEDKISEWFEEKEKYLKFIDQCYRPLDSIVEKCNFEIKTGQRWLPKYEPTQEELDEYGTKEDLFWGLVNKGLEKIIAQGKDPEEYLKRIDIEVDVFEYAGITDYFLIIHDIYNYCEKNDIITGLGRGSVAGSAIAFIFGISRVDPLEYDLLFERFINKDRAKKSLPDIDSDFPASRRDEVKAYIEKRFGVDNVCSVGTYGTYKIRSVFKDVCKAGGADIARSNYFSAMLQSDSDYASWEYQALVREIAKTQAFREFIQPLYDWFNFIPLCLGQAKNTSVHASAVLITPKTDGEGKPMTIYDWIPVKKIDGVLVSEWEGSELEVGGFLKEDILGVKQLDKIDGIRKLIEKNGKTPPPFDGTVDLKDKLTYFYLENGWNQDVFHFGSPGLTGYCQQVKPSTFEELPLIVSIYRPGAMEFGAHKDLINIKFGRKDETYDFGLQEIEKETFGLLVYQEQIMKAVQVLGGLTLVEADDVRRAMGKVDIKKITPYRDRFIKYATETMKCPPYEADRIWNKLVAFASYGFNKSHAVCYAMTGYYTQYLKVNFPMEFWTVSLQFADDSEIPERVNEINRTNSGIKLSPPDINNSQLKFISDYDKNTIYWSINSITRVGGVAVEAILAERERGGKFFSLQEFLNRVEKRKVNKACVTNLILAGCFDSLENIKDIRERKTLLVKYYQSLRDEIPVEYIGPDSNKEWFWYLKQKNVSGSGFFDYTKLYNQIKIAGVDQIFCPPERIALEDNLDQDCITAGIVKEIQIKKSKKGEFGHLIIDHNNAPIDVTLWNESWTKFKDQLKDTEDKLIAVSGRIVFDRFRNKNTIHSQEDTELQIL